jgi:magnesium-transporting ATPase (P-type)
MRQFQRDEYDRPGKIIIFFFLFVLFLCLLIVNLFFCVEFKGEEMISHINGSLQQYFSARLHNQRMFLSMFATIGLCLLVVGCVAGIYIMRFAVSPSVGNSNAQTLASIANAVLIDILNQIYSFLAEALSEWENHR